MLIVLVVCNVEGTIILLGIHNKGAIISTKKKYARR